MDQKQLENTIVYESTLDLPTYIIKGENPNPVFHSQYGVAHIYPYTLLDHIDQKPTLKKYRTLILENRYLRITVIPDLGGRVYSVFDKVSNAEVFYKNQVVKFSPLAIRGAFFSGGIEFSFPVAHAPTTADPVNWHIRQNTDGSASIALGGIEHISRLRWMITLTLFPDRCAVAQDVTLSNPYFLPGRFHYWTNASLDADDQTEFIYPFRRVRSYEFAGSATWPYARLDLIRDEPGLPGMEGTPKWPVEHMHDPFNFRWQKNMLTHVSIFGRDVRWDFFGAWQHSKNRGYVHYANHKDVAGMKLWSWGNAPIGIVNQSALTDDGSIYAETQCGAMETQLDFDFLTPFTAKNWREWWIPLRQIQGVTCASVEVSANLKLIPSGQRNQFQLLLGLCPAREFTDAYVELLTPDEALIAESVNISPHHPWTSLRPLDTRRIGDKPLRLLVRDASGNQLLDYTLEREPSPIKDEAAKSLHFTPAQADEFELGLYYEKLDQRDSALKHYKQALAASPNHPQANFRLGLMYLRAADYTQSAAHLRTALDSQVDEAKYYLAFIETQQGQIEPALRDLQALDSTSPLFYPAQICLAGHELRHQRFSQAASSLQQLQETHTYPSTLQTLLGIAYRKSGEDKKATECFQSALHIDPLNHVALRELSLISPIPAVRETLTRLLEDDRQYILDLACFYIGFGLLEDALDVLEEFGRGYNHPLVGYLGYWICQSLTPPKEGSDWLQRARDTKPDYVFPSRLEEINALTFAIQRHPEDSKAKFYLGNFYYARQRYDEALHLWEEAAADMSQFDVLFRNLGWAMWKHKNDLTQAVAHFERALSLNPLNQDLYLHLDELYKLTNNPQKRHSLLEKIKGLPDMREDVRKRSVLMRVELGQHEEALAIMQNEKFVPLEMDQTFHEVYVQAYLQLAEDHLRAGQIESAIEDYQKALEYPLNLGVGQPPDLKQAHIHYLLGLAYERLGRYSDALHAWHRAAAEHHSPQNPLYPYVESALDKISRYSELGLEISP